MTDASHPETISRIFSNIAYKQCEYIDNQEYRRTRQRRYAILILAEWTGLEPATPGVTGRYSNQLNYHSNFGGCCRDRTCDPRLVRAMLSQLS